MISGSGLGLCGFAAVAVSANLRAVAQAAPSTSSPQHINGGKADIEQINSARPKTIVATRAIHHQINLDATPARIYDALLSAKRFSDFSGMAGAQIDPQLGGTFSIFKGHIIGRSLELLPDRRIVQAWRAVDWPEGVYSIARFELTPRGSGTLLIFDHTGFPSKLAEHLETGWIDHYWNPLRKYLA
jgi:activator of HSP90 ATPase